jgi:glycosyltransferase involved in cell wall biosynthesis
MVHHYANTPDTFGDARHFSHARELIRRGHTVAIVACSFHHLNHEQLKGVSSEHWEAKVHDGVNFIWIPAQSYRNGAFRRVLNMFEFSLRAIRRDWAVGLERPDLILGSTPHPFAALAGERLAAHCKVPFVLEVRDAWPYILTEVGGYSRFHPFVQLVDRTMRFLYRRASAIVMLSKHSAPLLASYGADPRKILWIPHGVDLEMSPQPRPAPDDGIFTVSYIGAHNRWNSLDAVLDAARMLQESGTHNVLIRFVGNGECKPSLVARTRNEGIRNVRFEDSVPRNLLHEVLHESDAFVINNSEDGASRNWMSFSKLYAYLAAGRPVVFGSCTENDPVRDSGCGLSVAANDPQALAEGIRFMAGRTPLELARYGELGRAHIESEYSISVLVDRFEKMAFEIAGQSQSVDAKKGMPVPA